MTRPVEPIRADCAACGSEFVSEEGFTLCEGCREYDEWVKQNLPPKEGK